MSDYDEIQAEIDRERRLNLGSHRSGEEYQEEVELENMEKRLESGDLSLNVDDFLKRLSSRSKEKNVQPTYHQQLAIDLAKEFDDLKHLGIYLSLCKKHSTTKIVETRDKVRRVKNPRNKGALFLALITDTWKRKI